MRNRNNLIPIFESYHSAARDMDLTRAEKFPWNYYLLLPLIIAAIIVSSPSQTTGEQKNNSQFILIADTDYQSLAPGELLSLINSLSEKNALSSINIIEPLPDTVLPPDMASPAFLWEDEANTTAWLITIKINNKFFLKGLFNKSWWIPEKETWNRLKKAAGKNDIEVVIEGIGGWTGREIISRDSVFLRFSEDKVNAKLMFMRKPLPFLKAKKNPEKTSLLLGDPGSYKAPEPVLTNPPICANCHTYSLDGRHMAIDMDYGGDKGAFLYTHMNKEVVIENTLIYSWQEIIPQKPATYNMGLFARISPDGRFVAGTVNETSVFVMMDDLFFSQLFYPATGRIAIFDTRTKHFSLLPGASLDSRVQTSPSWSPDGKTILFCAVPTNPELIQNVVAKEILKESSKQNISDLNKKYPVQFDIYALPFNHSNGGQAKPLIGASHNGYSNYFPRYSPNGKWIVFTQSPTGLVLQPDSNLVIIPSEGGEPRPLNSNQAIMNSWHSWSPNSKWMVFTCKANSPYTELYLTHIDDQGVSSPGIRLFRFSSNELAAMVPEFVPRHSELPEKIIFGSLENAKKKSMAIDGR